MDEVGWMRSDGEYKLFTFHGAPARKCNPHRGAGFPDWLREVWLEKSLASTVVHLAASPSQIFSDAFVIGRPVKETTLHKVEDCYAYCKQTFRPNTRSERNVYAPSGRAPHFPHRSHVTKTTNAKHIGGQTVPHVMKMWIDWKDVGCWMRLGASGTI